jgi:putative chitinase
MEEFNINGPLRLSHFLSQCDHESGHFKAVYENLNYSSEALTKLFGRYFKGIDLHAYERNPEKIGSRIYANRMGNGAESSKEGYKFRGRGYIQLTGKSNYESFSEFIGEDCVENPDLVSTKYPLASAAFFFTKNKLWQICDKGATDEVVLMVTKRVNGGTIGYDDRLLKFKTCYSLVSQG